MVNKPSEKIKKNMKMQEFLFKPFFILSGGSKKGI